MTATSWKIRYRSHGHLFNSEHCEYYAQNGEIYAAPLGNPLDLDGYRQGGRWECSDTEFRREQLRKLLNIDDSAERRES